MRQEFFDFLVRHGLDANATTAQAWRFWRDLRKKLTDEQRREADALRRGQRHEPAPANGGIRSDSHHAANPSDGTDPVVAERHRCAQIRKLCRENEAEDLEEQLIDSGTTVDQTRAALLERLQAKRMGGGDGDGRSGPAVHSHSHEEDCTRQTLGAGLVARAGLDPVEAGQRMLRHDPERKHLSAEERRKEAERIANAGEGFQDMPLLDVCREALRLDGQRIPRSREETIRAATSTLSLANVFTDVVNASVQSGFDMEEDTTGPFTRDQPVNDFRDQESHKIGESDELDKARRGKEAEHADIADFSPEKWHVSRFTKQATVDDMDIVNDRLGALQEIPTKLGRAARRLRPRLAYYILLGNPQMADGHNLFDASNHGNAFASDKTLNADNFESAYSLMRKQTFDGVNIEITPRVLIVASDLEFTALELTSSAELRGMSSKQPTRNVIREKNLTVVSSAYIQNGVTDPESGSSAAGSGSAWFLAANPQTQPVIVIGTLAGTGGRPMTRSWRYDRNGRYGIGWDIKHDIGAKALAHQTVARGSK